ncbi:outer membrane biosynthesis protein TonB [Oxalobacteraceae bacterium GrIS 1.18]
MKGWARQYKQWWNRPSKPGTRLFTAVTLSLALHLVLLTLQFGEYGAGLPGFELPNRDRRAHAPEIHLNLQQPDRPTPTSVEIPVTPSPVAPPNDLLDRSRASVAVFDVVPKYRAIEIPKQIDHAVTSEVKNSARRVRHELLTSAAINPDFKVAESDQAKLDPAEPSNEKQPEMRDTKPDPEVPNPSDQLPIDQAAHESIEKIAAEKIVEARKLEQERNAEREAAQLQEAQKQLIEQQQKEAAVRAEAQKSADALEQARLRKLAQEKQQAELMAARELELQRQAQLAAQQAEKLKQEEVIKQQAQARLDRENAELEKAQQASVAARIAEEQRKLVQAQRLEQLKQEQAKKEQLEREFEEKQRLQQEDFKRRQEQQEKLLAEQKAAQIAEQARENARQQETSRLAAEAKKRLQQAVQSNDLSDILGVQTGSTAGNKQDLDKLLSGRSADFDKSGNIVKSSGGTTVPTPDLVATPNARRSIFGSKNGDVELNLYIQSWRQKIERNGQLNYSQMAKDKIHNDPIVTVSVRSDGSVENVIILRSSGRKDIDDAVRRIALVNSPFSVFPPSLARKYDVIDIRQIWLFSEILRITDELR